MRKVAATGFRWLASLQLAIVLLVVLAAVLAVATFVERDRGREFTHWYVYDSLWFRALLGLLAANVLAAALIRFPWKKSQIGFLATHAGLLVLLFGSIRTFDDGIEGHLALEQGQTTNALVLTDRSELRAAWRTPPGQPRRMTAVFDFTPGPVDWADRAALDLGEIEGVQLRVLKYYAHARTIEEWVASGSDDGIPAIEFAFLGPDGTAIRRDWLAEDEFAGAAIGPTKLELHRAPADSMLEDFDHPPAAKDMDGKGVLSVHCQGHVQRIAVSENLGKQVAIGDSGISVELTEYLANAKSDALGRFASAGNDPQNPRLEFRVHLPGKDVPIRQIAFATLPFLNFDALHEQSSPIKFWYHHPAVSVESAIEFLQTSDGQLHCRVAAGGKYESRGAVKAGDRIETAGKFALAIEKHFPHARQKVTFEPVEVAGRAEPAGVDPAALVELTAAGKTERVWLKHNDPSYGTQRVVTPEGEIALSFGYETLPLGFELSLLSFKHGMNPGRMGDASFASTVRLVDKARGVDESREISMNEPLAHDKYVFYQSSYNEAPGQPTVSILTAAYDPGRWLKYLGSLMVCGGMLLVFIRKRRS